MNIWDILILTVILAAMAAAFQVMKTKKGRGGCGCGCDGCKKNCASRQNGPDKTK